MPQFIIASGGIYDAQAKMASFDSVEPHLRFVFGYIRVEDVTFITARGTKVLRRGMTGKPSSLRVFRPHIVETRALDLYRVKAESLYENSHTILKRALFSAPRLKILANSQNRTPLRPPPAAWGCLATK